MKRLTKKEYWDSLYQSKRGKQRRFKYFRTVCYSERILRDNIYQRYLPKKRGLKILEVGSAPGGNLIKFHQRFGYSPYGVEYSEKGLELNRKKFISHNLNPNNVILADFFSDEFQGQYKEFFDIVFSRGFLEHFSDAKEVVKKHLNLLASGGFLIVIIPNLKGVNYFLQSIFDKEVLPKHNLKIMERQKFLELFNKKDLTTLYCNYFGTFNFGLFKGAKKFCDYLQWILNLIFYLLFKNKGLEHKFFSPYLIFIGKKK